MNMDLSSLHVTYAHIFVRFVYFPFLTISIYSNIHANYEMVLTPIEYDDDDDIYV